MTTFFRALFEAAAWACFAELCYVRQRAHSIAIDKPRPDPYWAGIHLWQYGDRIEYNEDVAS